MAAHEREECKYLVTLGVSVSNYLISLLPENGTGGGLRKKKHLERLRDHLGSIHSQLEREPGESDTMQKWRKKLKHEASAANQLLAELASQLVLHPQKTNTEERYAKKLSKYKQVRLPTNFCIHLQNIRWAFKIKRINLMLHQIITNVIQPKYSSVDLGTPRPETITVGHNNNKNNHTLNTCAISSIVGRDKDVSKVRDMVLSMGHVGHVILIEGEIGVGSTTVAQLVYQDDKIVQRFGDQRLWIAASHGCNMSKILIEMLESLTGRVFGSGMDQETMLTKLKQTLIGKKYLIVLDAFHCVNNIEAANLVSLLIDVSHRLGSMFLITAEYSTEQKEQSQENVVESFYRLTHHHLEALSEEDSWTLFTTWAFADGGPKETPALAVIVHDVLQACHGLPLLINLFAGLMHEISEQERSNLQNDETWSRLRYQIRELPAFQMSDLLRNITFPMLLYLDSSPPFLKQCFAYCSLFPKDYDIDKDNLIQLWMSQGYLQPSLGSNLEMEDVGEDYFNFFCRSSFFQGIKFDEFYNVTSCKMHDMVHDLAISVSGSNFFIETPSSGPPDRFAIKYRSLHSNTVLVMEDLRTLFVTGNHPINIGDANLRTISVNQEAVRELPSSLSECMYLTYLDISRTSIETLPDFITKLRNLQTLRLPSPRYFKKLPQEFYKLVYLRHFYYRYPVYSRNARLVPVMLGCLTSLQTLPFFFVGEDSGRKIEELGSLHNLRGQLEIFNLEKVRNKEEAVKANLSGKSKILALKLCWSYIREEGKNNDGDVLEWLQPCRDLKRLEMIHFRGERLALWMNRSSNLVSIKLWYCTECKQIPKLGHLPNLEVVELSGFHILEHIDPEFYGDRFMPNTSASETARASATIFPALRKLTLVDMPNLVEWSDIRGTAEFFPKLEKITIMGCPSLVTIPCHLLSFQEVFIHSTDSIIRNDSIKKTYQPFLAVGVDPDSKIDILLQDILRKSSESLRKLKLLKLDKLSCLSNNLQNLSSLTNLEVSECHNLSYLVNEIRDGFCSLTSLNTLTIKQCPRLESCWGKSLHSLTNLRTLEIGGFSEELEYFPWPSSKSHVNPLGLLETLSLRGWPNLQSLPDQLQNLTALRNLSIVHFDGLKTLSEWMTHISSLQSLWIQQCKNLRALPSLKAMKRLTSLDSLYICKCSILEERCQRESGEEWHKIEHIRSVNIYPFTPDIGDEELDLS